MPSPRDGAVTSSESDTVQAFIDELGKSPGGDHVVSGMVKPADTPDGLMFAHPGDCTRWVHIPATAIQSIRGSGRVGCSGHTHATAEIQLKDPQSELEKTFANIASLHREALGRLQSMAQTVVCNGQTCLPGQVCGTNQSGDQACVDPL